MVRCVRMWTGDDGDSRFEEGRIELAECGGDDRWTPDGAATSVSFRETPPGGGLGWHRDPVPRLVLTLSGTLEFEVRSGARFAIRPGDVLLAEDDTGTGHTWRLVGDEPWRRCYVVVPDPSRVPFRPDTKDAR